MNRHCIEKKEDGTRKNEDQEKVTIIEINFLEYMRNVI